MFNRKVSVTFYSLSLHIIKVSIMGGEGSMAAANSSLKNNRSLVGERKYKDVKTLILHTSGKTELEFKQLDSRELAKIKDQIRLKARQTRQQNTFIISALLLVIISILALVIF